MWSILAIHCGMPESYAYSAFTENSIKNDGGIRRVHSDGLLHPDRRVYGKNWVAVLNHPESNIALVSDLGAR